jgi:hypothetical protein
MLHFRGATAWLADRLHKGSQGDRDLLLCQKKRLVAIASFSPFISCCARGNTAVPPTPQCRLDPLSCPTAELLATTFVTVTFTTHKIGVRGKTLGHDRSGHPKLCLVAALTRRLLTLCLSGATPTTPINALCPSPGARRQFVPPCNVTTILRRAVGLLHPALTYFAASNISARSARASGAMTMLCGSIDSDRIRLIGRWRLDKMNRYLHVQTQPVMAGVAAIMVRGGDYRLNTLPLPAGPGGPPFPSSTLTLLSKEVPPPIHE